MSLEGLTTEGIAQLEEALFERVPDPRQSEFDTIGNVTLRSQLMSVGWTEDEYWEIRNRLIDAGRLRTGKGKGGSVKRVQLESEPTTEVVVEPPVPSGAVKESDLYRPMASVLQSRWALDSRLDAAVLDITAAAGSKSTGGKWTRPDITIDAYRTFPYVPGKFFDVVVFEVKPYWALDVTVVYEALAHRRAAHRAFALVHVPADKLTELRSVLDEVESEAKKFGVGLITADKPDDYDTWDTVVDAVRHEPNPERVNDFLAQQVGQVFRDTIMKWFR